LLVIPKSIATNLLLFAALISPVLAQDPAHRNAEDAAYRASIEKWRADYEADLRSDHGWLIVAGLFWLHEGENKFGSDPLNDIVLPAPAPAEAGYFALHDGIVTAHVNPGAGFTLAGKPVETAELKPDSATDRLSLDDLTLYIHASGSRRVVRLLDKNSSLRRNFSGLHWFPIDASYRVTARFVSYDPPRKIQMQNLSGDSLEIPLVGTAIFILQGQELRLDAYDDAPGKIEFIFRDLTSGKETYAAARFLDTDAPATSKTGSNDGEVVLDFNEAYNPPCAYNPFTTCPLPPPQNRLHPRIPAGEMAYHYASANRNGSGEASLRAQAGFQPRDRQ
jgi:uncharacterized protein